MFRIQNNADGNNVEVVTLTYLLLASVQLCQLGLGLL